jgi:hypothetical protein
MAYEQIEPWGEERADLRSGIVAATMANLWGSKHKRYKPSDFMVKTDTAPRATGAELAKRMKTWARMYNESRGFKTEVGK